MSIRKLPLPVLEDFAASVLVQAYFGALPRTSSPRRLITLLTRVYVDKTVYSQEIEVAFSGKGDLAKVTKVLSGEIADAVRRPAGRKRARRLTKRNVLDTMVNLPLDLGIVR